MRLTPVARQAEWNMLRRGRRRHRRRAACGPETAFVDRPQSGGSSAARASAFPPRRRVQRSGDSSKHSAAPLSGISMSKRCLLVRRIEGAPRFDGRGWFRMYSLSARGLLMVLRAVMAVTKATSNPETGLVSHMSSGGQGIDKI